MALLGPEVLAFVALSALLTITPGADMALVAAKTLRHGRAVANLTSVGILSGLFVHAAASAVGLSALLATSATAFEAVKWAGAGVLVLLGAKALWESRPGAPPRVPAAHSPRIAAADRRHLAHGFLSNLLNPKVALFYLIVLPQFILPGDPAPAKAFLLAGIHVGMWVLWLPLYAWMIDRAVATARGSRVRTWLERATGGALIALGARLAVERAPGAG